MEYQMGDMAIVQKGDDSEFQKQKQVLVEQTRTANAEIDKTIVKRSKVMALMTDFNQNNDFQGRLRFLFGQWREHTRRQKHFAMCIKSVMLKSLWQRGFQNIREFSRDKKLTRDQNSSLAKMRNMFWRLNCGRAFSKWR